MNYSVVDMLWKVLVVYFKGIEDKTEATMPIYVFVFSNFTGVVVRRVGVVSFTEQLFSKYQN